MKLGDVLKKERERRDLPVEEVAQSLQIPLSEYLPIEEGQSALEDLVPIVLGFARQIDAPLSSIFFPCGLPYTEINDYRADTY